MEIQAPYSDGMTAGEGDQLLRLVAEDERPRSVPMQPKTVPRSLRPRNDYLPTMTHAG